MLGRRKRKDARVVDAARGQLSTAEINARAVLATVMTQIELPASRVLEERERLQASTETAIENSYDLVTGSTTRLERPALGEHPASPARHDEHTADPWCRDNSHWIRGVEIAHVSNENDTIRYWLRRKSDGYIIPRTFDVNDVCFLPEVPTRSAAMHAADTEVEPDCSAVESVAAVDDVIGLLVTLARDVEQSGSRIVWYRAPKPMRAQLEVAGVGHLFNWRG